MDLLVRIGLMRCWAALALLTLALVSESSLREGVMREPRYLKLSQKEMKRSVSTRSRPSKMCTVALYRDSLVGLVCDFGHSASFSIELKQDWAYIVFYSTRPKETVENTLKL